MIDALVLIFQFLTRLPISIAVDADDKTFRDGIYFFTLVGTVLGAILLAVESGLSVLQLDAWSKAIILLVVHIFLTGGLHLDGVADTADALFSNRPKARMLEILRDSRIGSNGVLALIITLALKAVGLHFIIATNCQLALLAMPIIGRLAVVMSFYWGKTPRAVGMGNFFIGKADWRHLLANVLLPIGVVALAGAWRLAFLVSAVLVLLYVVLVIAWSNRKIDGITGDLLGFIIETSEVVFLLNIIVISGIGGLL